MAGGVPAFGGPARDRASRAHVPDGRYPVAMPATRVRPGHEPSLPGRSARSRLWTLAIAAVLVSGGAGGTALPAAAAADPAPAAVTVASAAPTTLGASVTFYGRGWGHGVGMSQYGAYGRARAGQTAEQILAHYYQGTTLGTVDPTTPIRVLVLGGWTPTATVPLLIIGTLGTWSIDGQTGTFPASASMTLAPPASGTTAWPLTVTSSTGTVLLSTTVSASFRVRPVATTTLIRVFSKPSHYDTFRGVVRVVLGTTAVSVVNELGLDAYLRGVVPSEVPASWPAAAVAAQAIAARSFATFQLRPGVGAFDVYDDSLSQVYHGYLGEASGSDAAVAATAGKVLLSGGSVADTLYHSSDGGATENAEIAFNSPSGLPGTAYPYLVGSPDFDPSGNPYDAASPYETWQTATYTPAQLSTIFGSDSRTSVGTLTALDLSHRGASGRLVTVVLYGSGGSKVVSGNVFRNVFNGYRPSSDASMLSTLFDLQPIGGDFTIAAAPATFTVKQGLGTSYAVTLTRKYFNAPIDLSVSGLPAGASAVFGPTPATASSSTMTIVTSAAGTVTPVGTYPLTITGSYGTFSHTASVALVVADGIPPTVVAPGSGLYGITTLGSTTTLVRTGWSAADPSGIKLEALERSIDGGGWGSVALASATAVAIAQPLAFGHTYRYGARATDAAGNTSAWAFGPAITPLLTQQSSSAVVYTGTWRTVTSAYVSGGSLRYATGYGASASYTFTGSSIAWLAYRGPNRGSARVYVDGVLKATVSLYASSYLSKQVVYAFSWAANGTHTIKIVNLATSGRPRIDLDGFIRLFLS
jgi:stage II sporulation protein D